MEEIRSQGNVKSTLGAECKDNGTKWSKNAVVNSNEKLVDRVLSEGFDKSNARGKNDDCNKQLKVNNSVKYRVSFSGSISK